PGCGHGHAPGRAEALVRRAPAGGAAVEIPPVRRVHCAHVVHGSSVRAPAPARHADPTRDCPVAQSVVWTRSALPTREGAEAGALTWRLRGRGRSMPNDALGRVVGRRVASASSSLACFAVALDDGGALLAEPRGDEQPVVAVSAPPASAL